jgi:ribosomal protein S18 acetylase RimI-like enzyme
MPHVVVAEDQGAVVGVAAADAVEWNRTVQVEYLFVRPDVRGQGIGRELMSSVMIFARDVQASCVWLETQNVNYLAVQFYQRLGFRLCGVNDRWYGLGLPQSAEVALFFAIDIA